MTPPAELFEIPVSEPPRLESLRRRYDDAKAALDAAEAHEDESGEAVPRDLRREFREAEHLLAVEEARCATGFRSSIN